MEYCCTISTPFLLPQIVDPAVSWLGVKRLNPSPHCTAHSGLSKWSPSCGSSGKRLLIPSTEASFGGQILNCLIQEMSYTVPLGVYPNAMVSLLREIT